MVPPTFFLNIKTHINKKFLPLLDKHFAVNHKYRQIFLTDAQLKYDAVATL